MTQVYRALNAIRIQTMKSYGLNTRAYRQLKRYWKLLLKDETTLNYIDFRKRRNYHHAYLTDQEVVDRLLALSPELQAAYNFFQDILYAVRHKDFEQLQTTITVNLQLPRFRQLPGPMKKARLTLMHHLSEIENSFTYKFSNGPVEELIIKLKLLSVLHTVFVISNYSVCVY